MKQSNWKPIVVLLLFVPSVHAQQPAPDVILSNGKVITVDDRFRIAEAVAITGERIAAVGTDPQIAALAGPNTRTIDLGGRSVIPGLIDNHAHIMEEGPIWQLELRLDGVETRAGALGDDSGSCDRARTGRVGLFTGRVGDRSVHRRLQSFHTCGT